jgi:hypothetical protein
MQIRQKLLAAMVAMVVPVNAQTSKPTYLSGSDHMCKATLTDDSLVPCGSTFAPNQSFALQSLKGDKQRARVAAGNALTQLLDSNRSHIHGLVQAAFKTRRNCE